MCLAIPAQIISVEGTDAEVKIGTITRKASLWLVPQAKTGDYVLLHAGYAISVVDQAEAEETLALFREISEKTEQLWQ
jgi:hydrogenase expression/formation protein HypC